MSFSKGVTPFKFAAYPDAHLKTLYLLPAPIHLYVRDTEKCFRIQPAKVLRLGIG